MGSKSTQARALAALRARIGLRVRNIDRRSLQNAASRKYCSFRAHRMLVSEKLLGIGRAPRAAPKCSSSPSNRVTKTDHASSRLIARSATASSTGCTSVGELAMTFNISAVAACCSRASFRSLLGSETERRLTRVAAGAMRGLVLVVLRPFAGLASGFRLALLAARS